MDFVVKEYNKKYEINFGKITQILGYNFKIKRYIYESILKHFSLYKYQDFDEHMENNITIDEQLIEQISINKNTLIYEYLKNVLETLSCQRMLNVVDENLTNIYLAINEKLNSKVGKISIDYEMQNLFYIVSKSDVYTNSGEDIETLSNYDLLIVLLKLVKENNSVNPEKTLILLNNIDHLCTRFEYDKIVEFLRDYDESIFAIMFISIDKYVYISKEVLNNIVVINDTTFQVPKYESIEEYLLGHYPMNYEFEETEIVQLLKNTLNSIGIENDIISYKELLVKKLINKAICINDSYDFNMETSELSCLNTK